MHGPDDIVTSSNETVEKVGRDVVHLNLSKNYALDDFVEVKVVHEFEDEDDASFFGEDGFGNNSLASHDGKLEVPGFDKLVKVGDFED